ncbi:MAG: acyl-CoA dehydrogenase [Rhodococcus sp. (in: high G+C Gram-positive bacteria)]|uniref:acyl-CoA dehydrogenase family protein n=1 Tax=Rhodococcus sp. TaxID=1831 RepID=UPI00120E40EB|nr:acyl-CoA dehydrogenase family protein [Rhodococcus sp. (in: high G+C Gram-positive bacteria)]RZL24930.1 MAG: acyl-CoA dehydrogenase [Rhodococcus sp. (in: high G+C Gram-positive bacteria)]
MSNSGSSRFSSEQVEYAHAVRAFCNREARTREQRDALTDNGRECHSPELHQKFADAGLLAVSIPEEYGGSGGGLVEQCLMFEEIFRGLAPLHGAGTSHTVAGIYKKFANEEQKKDALAAISSGTVMSISISEPEAGSDAANISCKAEKVDQGYRITGQKTWCSDAQFAGRILLVARTSRGEKRHDGLTMLEVPAGSEGLDINPISTMGGREVNDLFFTDVLVPDSAVVGEAGGAWKQVMAGLNGERLVCAAQALGSAQRTFDDLLDFVKERKQFGQPIGTFQALRHRIADIAIEIEAARALTYDTVLLVQKGTAPADELVRRTSMAKVKMTEVAKKVALEGVQMMGGYGYATEYGMESHLRHSIAPTIYAGTNEVQREIISSTFGLR